MRIFIHRMRDSVAGDYIHRLTAALGTSAFDAIFAELKGLGREVVVEIADEFSGGVAPSSSARKAMEAIWLRHSKLVRFKAGDADWQSYASDLKRLELNNSAFDALIDRLRSDSGIKQPEMHQIASQYLGWTPAKSKPKSDLLRLIIDSQAVTARQTARMPANFGGKSW